MKFYCLIICLTIFVVNHLSANTVTSTVHESSKPFSLRGELEFEIPVSCEFNKGEGAGEWMNANVMCQSSYAVQFLSSKLKNDIDLDKFAEGIRSGYDRSDFGHSGDPKDIKSTFLGQENVGKIIFTEFSDKSKETWKTEIYKLKGKSFFYFVWVSGPKDNLRIWLEAKEFMSSITIN